MISVPVSFSLRLAALAGLAFLVLPSCGRQERVEVVQSRDPFKTDAPPELGLTASQRYADNKTQETFSWETPEGWFFLPSTEFRQINFAFGPKREGECYLTLLSMSAGDGLRSNLNRWRKQMGLPDLTQEEVDALPTKPVFRNAGAIIAKPAPFIDVTGTYTGGSGPMMAPSEPLPGYRMIGAILEAPGMLITIKMTGPEALVAANAAKFDQFCSSLGIAGMPSGGL